MMASDLKSASMVPLNGKNYSTWKLQVKMMLVKDGLWGIVNGSEAAPASGDNLEKFATRRDRALAIVVLSLDTSILYLIGDPTDPAQVWKKLEDQFQKKSWVNKLNLRRNLYSLKLHEGGSTHDHIKKMTEIFDGLSAIGDNIDEEDRVVHLLASLPDSYNMLVTAFQANIDIPKMEMVTERLLHEEQKLCNQTVGVSHGEQLLVGKFNSKSFLCYNCGKPGHYKRNCRELLKRQSHSNNFHSSEKFRKRSQLNQAYVESNNNHSDGESSGFVAHQLLNVINSDKYEWVIDSGASRHMCNNSDLFSDTVFFDTPQKVILGDNHTIYATAKGTVLLEMQLPNNNVRSCHLYNVLYVPSLAYNLLSIPMATKSNYLTVFRKDQCQIFDQKEQLLALGEKVGSLFYLKCSVQIRHKLNATRDIKCDNLLWHKRYCHLGEQNLLKIKRNNLVEDFKYNHQQSLDFCGSCIMGKSHRLKFPKSETRNTELLGLVHSDVCGKIGHKSLSDSEYFLTFTDDSTRYCWVYFLKQKSEVFDKFVEWKSMVEKTTGKNILILRTDNGGEYKSLMFETFLKKEGIVHQFTVPYTPEQNGVSERLNRTLIETSRCMLTSSQLPKKFWAETLSTAVYVKNRSPVAALSDMTPYEAFTGKKPSVKHFRVFGCACYAHIPKEERKKLDFKAKLCIFLGYCSTVKGYRLYNVNTGKVLLSRDVVFDELRVGNIISNESSNIDENGRVSFGDLFNISSGYDNIEDVCTDNLEVEEKVSRYPSRNRKQTEFFGDRACLVNSILNEPRTVKEALNSSESSNWMDAMKLEMNSMHKNKVWDLVPLPEERKIVNCKWVYKVKTGPDNMVQCYKARLVAQGFSQKFGVDYDETFSPVVRFESVRTVIALAAQYDLKLHQMDVTSAFLNGNLNEDIYMKQPECFVSRGGEDLVCKLNKSIYGLKQSPRCWNTSINEQLTTMGFIHSSSDPCIYTATEGEYFVVAVYVDDIILAGKVDSKINEIKEKLMSAYDMKDMGELKYFLGVQINRDKNLQTIFLGQETYCSNLLEKYGMQDCKQVDTPSDINVKLQVSVDGDNKVDLKMFQSCVGSLLYLAIKTRPDITFSVNSVAKFCSNPNNEHWTAVKRIMRYLKGTSSFGLLYIRDTSLHTAVSFVGYSDADWAGDVDNRRSVSGYCYLLGSCLISWSSRKQSCVALSTAEAEYMALAHASQEAVWLRQLFEDLNFPQDSATLIFEDNQAAITISKNNQISGRSKHIDIKFHFIREHIANDIINLSYCPTEKMLADIFTKGLCRDKFLLIRNLIGVKSPYVVS